MEKIKKLIENSEGVSIGLSGSDPYYLRDVARKIPELVEGFPPSPSDYIVIDPEGEDIGIDEVRNISTFFSFSPELSKRKYVIVFDIDRMTQQAANAFLKTLEEPPKFGVLICTTARWNYLLPTIRSRLVKFVLNPPPVDEKDKRVKIIMERDFRTREKNWKNKLKKVEKMKLSDLIKSVKKMDDDPMIGYLAAFRILDEIEKSDDKDFLKIFNETTNHLSGKEFFFFNTVLSRVALWELEISGTEDVQIVKFLDSISRAKIANFNNALTLLNIMIRYREEKRGDEAWS